MCNLLKDRKNNENQLESDNDKMAFSTLSQQQVNGTKYCRQQPSFMEWLRDVKFAIQIVSDWLQMGQICDFLRSVSAHLILKSPRFVPFGASLAQL